MIIIKKITGKGSIVLQISSYKGKIKILNSKLLCTQEQTWSKIMIGKEEKLSLNYGKI